MNNQEANFSECARGKVRDGECMKFEASEIEERMSIATRTLLKKDLLLLRNDSDEWSISHKLAEYLQKQFPDWHVDVEYNRDKNQVKKLNNENVRPDIIVHIRDTDNNLLVIEVKKSNNPKFIDDDRKRLLRFTSQNGRYKYLFGVLVIFHVAEEYRKQPTIELFQNNVQLR